MGCSNANWGGSTEGGHSYVHVHAAREENLAGRVKKQDALDQIQRVDNQQVILAVAASYYQPVERRKEALCDIPLEAFLQLEKLAEGGVASQVVESLPRR